MSPTKRPELRREQNLKARYNLRGDDVQELLDKQGGLCAICHTVPSRPCVDHDHATGKIRGILCHGCNVKLGVIEDAAFLKAALEYLETT